MKDSETNYPISTSDFKNQCRKLLLEKVESKELDLTKEQILNLQITISIINDNFEFGFDSAISEKIPEKIHSEMYDLFKSVVFH